MGCFDCLMIKCPVCNHIFDEQFKSGPCLMETYVVDNAPWGILEAIDNEPMICHKCKAKFVHHIKITHQIEILSN